MLTYTFSRREKFLIGLFTVLLLAVGWYQLVYVTATDQIRELESQIESVELDISTAQTKLAKKNEMERVIEQRIEEGAKSTPIPYYDNIKPLMSELDSILSKTQDYTLSFDALDTESSEYILRGVGMQFGCESYEAAENIIRSIADGTYPCLIDSVSVSVSSSSSSSKSDKANAKAVVHVIFYERPQSTR